MLEERWRGGGVEGYLVGVGWLVVGEGKWVTGTGEGLGMWGGWVERDGGSG